MKRLLCIVLVVGLLLAGSIWAYVSFTRDRALTEADFRFLERGMSLEEIVAVVGDLSGVSGSGWLRPYYELDSGTLFLSFNEQYGPPFHLRGEDLSHIIIEYSDGSERRIDLEAQMTRVLNVDIEYREIRRSLTRDDLRDLRIGSSLAEVREKIGLQNGWLGRGATEPFYILGEGEYAILHFRVPGSRRILERIEIVNDTEILEEIIPAGELRLVTINNMELEYIEIDRSLTRDDFRDFRLGSSSAEVEEQIGEPNGGAGMASFYMLEDGEYAWLFFWGTSEPMELWRIQIANESEVLEVILEG